MSRDLERTGAASARPLNRARGILVRVVQAYDTSGMQSLDERIIARCSRSQREALDAAAAQQGITGSELLRRLVQLAGEPRVAALLAKSPGLEARVQAFEARVQARLARELEPLKAEIAQLEARKRGAQIARGAIGDGK